MMSDYQHGGVVVWLLVIAFVVGGAGAFRMVPTVCERPLPYRIGQIDERFSISREVFFEAMQAAETAWEKDTGVELLSHDPNASFSIQLVFDERQQETLRLQEIERDLAGSGQTLEEMRAEYTALGTEYETRLRAYEQEVQRWNSRSGAPPDAFRRLQEERTALERLRVQLNALAQRINAQVQTHNQTVQRYNSRVSGEFTQGDYTGRAITIYQFGSREELVLVLAHELGHALGLGHIADAPEAIMFRMMGEQKINPVRATDHDILAVTTYCGVEKILEEQTAFERFWRGADARWETILRALR